MCLLGVVSRCGVDQLIHQYAPPPKAASTRNAAIPTATAFEAEAPEGCGRGGTSPIGVLTVGASSSTPESVMLRPQKGTSALQRGQCRIHFAHRLKALGRILPQARLHNTLEVEGHIGLKLHDGLDVVPKDGGER